MARRLMRNTEGAVLGGVAAGFGDYFDADPVLVRLAFVLLALLHGLGVVFYIVCWVIMPRRETLSVPAGTPPPVGERIAAEVREAGEKAAQALRRTPGNGSRGRIVFGVVLIVLGGVLLLERFSWFHWPHWARLADLWPLALVAIGIALVVGAGRAER